MGVLGLVVLFAFQNCSIERPDTVLNKDFKIQYSQNMTDLSHKKTISDTEKKDTLVLKNVSSRSVRSIASDERAF